MKYLIIPVFICLTSGLLFNCNSSAQRVENAEEKVFDAKEDLEEANQEYLADVKKFKEETAAKIKANNESIAEFNAKLEKENAYAEANYKNKVDALEKKNSELKKKIDEYQADGKDQWENFKTEFNRDMDELGVAFKNLTTNNSN